jgi:hypothetical protein
MFLFFYEELPENRKKDERIEVTWENQGDAGKEKKRPGNVLDPARLEVAAVRTQLRRRR